LIFGVSEFLCTVGECFGRCAVILVHTKVNPVWYRSLLLIRQITSFALVFRSRFPHKPQELSTRSPAK
jgi:hypothetical protein